MPCNSNKNIDMAKKRKRSIFLPRPLLLICIIAGIATLVLNMANGRMKVKELGEVAGWTGTAFVISLLIIIGIWVVNYINKR
jgi:hypothetical protein